MVETLVMAPLSRKYGTRVFTVLPARPHGMKHAFAFPVEAGPHVTDPELMEMEG